MTRRAWLTVACVALFLMATERILPAVPSPVGQGRAGATIVAPNQLLFTGEEHLRIRAWCSLAGVTLQITTRFLLPDGTIDVTQSAMDPGADRAPRAADIKLTRGYLLNVVVRVQSGSIVNGQCFATVSIVRGDNATIVVGQLLGGYVTSFQMLGWPGSPISSPTDGLGYLTGGSDSAPPQTGQYAVSVPTGARWRLTTVGYQIQAGASVGTRFGNLVIALPGSILVWFHNQQATATAGNGVQWVWARGAADNAGLAGSGSGSGPLPEECDLVAGSFFRTVAVGFLAGDTVLNAFWCVREWLEAA